MDAVRRPGDEALALAPSSTSESRAACSKTSKTSRNFASRKDHISGGNKRLQGQASLASGSHPNHPEPRLSLPNTLPLYEWQMSATAVGHRLKKRRREAPHEYAASLPHLPRCSQEGTAIRSFSERDPTNHVHSQRGHTTFSLRVSRASIFPWFLARLRHSRTLPRGRSAAPRAERILTAPVCISPYSAERARPIFDSRDCRCHPKSLFEWKSCTRLVVDLDDRGRGSQQEPFPCWPESRLQLSL